MVRSIICSLLLLFSIFFLPFTIYSSDQVLQEKEILLMGARNARAAGHYEDAIKRYQRLLSLSPELTDIRLEYAGLLSELGRRKEAIAEIKKVIAVLPNDVRVLGHLADAYIANRNFMKAAKTLKRIYEIKPHDIDVLRKLASVYLWDKRYPEAADLYKKMVSLDPKNKEGITKVFIDSFPDPDTALREIKRLLENDPDNDTLRERLVDLLRWGHRYDEAFFYCSEALKKKHTSFWINKCDTLLREEVDWLLSKNEFDEAIIILKDLVSFHPGDIELKKKLAMALGWGKYYKASIKKLEEILELTPADDELRRQLIDIASWAEEYEIARKHYLILLERYPEDINLRKKYISLLEAGNLKEDLIKELSQLIIITPADLEAKYRLAMLYEDKKEFTKAEELLRDIVQRDRHYRDAAYHLALVLSWNQKYDTAISYLEEMLKVDDNPQIRLLYAETLFYAGRLRDSKKPLEPLIQKTPIRAKLLYAEILLRELDFIKAEAYFREILKDEPRNVRAVLGLIDSLNSLGQFKESEKLIKELSAITEADKNEVCTRSALTYGYQNRFQKAYEELDKFRPTDMYPLKEAVRAELLNMEGHYFQSGQELRGIIKSFPDDYRLNLAYIESLKGQGNTEEMVSVYERLLKRYPQDLKLRLGYVELLLIRMQWDQAEAGLKNILNEYPNSIFAQYLMLKYYLLKGDEGSVDIHLQKLINRVKQGDFREAVLVQRLMFKDKMFRELVIFSKAFQSEIAFKNLDFAIYFLEGIKNQERITPADRYIAELVSNFPDNPVFNFSMAEMGIIRGNHEEAKRWLKKTYDLNPPDILRPKMAYAAYRIKEYNLSSKIIKDILETEPDNIYARVEQLRLLKDSHHLSEEDKRWIETLPIPIQFDIIRYMAFTSNGKDDPLFKIALEMLNKVIEEDKQNEEAIVILADILTANQVYDKAIDIYTNLIKTYPFLKSYLAEIQSWIREYEKSIKGYEEYLTIKPYDLLVMRKQARAYGWRLDYETSIKRYDDILLMNPGDKKVSLERDAKYNFWGRRPITAERLYRELLYKEPQNEEALFDLAQIYSQEGFYEGARRIYQDLLYLVPKHQQAILAINAVNHYLRPRLEFGYLYNDEKGLNNQRLIKYDDFNFGLSLPISERFATKIKYDRVRFDLTDGKDINADGYTLEGDYRFNLNLLARGFIGKWKYKEYDTDKTVFSLQPQYKSDDYRVKVGYDRSVFWENAFTIQSNMHFDRISAGIEKFMLPRLGHRLIVGLNTSWSRLSDSNQRWTGEILGDYELTPFPRILKIIPKLEYLDFADTKVEYFAPRSYSKYGINIEWWHFLNRDYFHEADKKYYALWTGVANDSRGVTFVTLGAEIFYEIGQRFGIKVRAELVRSSDYDKESVSGGVYYRF